MKPIFLSPVPCLILSAGTSNLLSTGYIAGAILAIVILGYLIYSLIKPEKF